MVTTDPCRDPPCVQVLFMTLVFISRESRTQSGRVILRECLGDVRQQTHKCHESETPSVPASPFYGGRRLGEMPHAAPHRGGVRPPSPTARPDRRSAERGLRAGAELRAWPAPRAPSRRYPCDPPRVSRATPGNARAGARMRRFSHRSLLAQPPPPGTGEVGERGPQGTPLVRGAGLRVPRVGRGRGRQDVGVCAVRFWTRVLMFPAQFLLV